MELFCITGRQNHDLAGAEIEALASRLPSQWTTLILPSDVVLLKSVDEIADKDVYEALPSLQDRLGGTLRIGEVLGRTAESQVLPFILGTLKRSGLESRKIIAVSAFSKGLDARKTGMQAKRLAKESGMSVRYVMPKEGDELSTAQVWHEGFAVLSMRADNTATNFEFCLWKQGSEWVVGRTLTVQNIESYTRRDFGIPFPDPVNGMVPPKLAQMMVNVAVGTKWQDVAVYDPFCGSGRIVSEGRLLGYASWGSDINAKVVHEAQQNVQQVILTETGEALHERVVWEHDALKVEENEQLQVRLVHTKPGAWHVVSEPFLGRPLRNPLTEEQASRWTEEMLPLYVRFLETWSKESLRKAGYKTLPKSILITIPAVQVVGREKTYRSLYGSLVDTLPRFRYSCIQLFRYGRPDALIKREIVHLVYDD